VGVRALAAARFPGVPVSAVETGSVDSLDATEFAR
jgi:hypothetical protein